MNLKPTLLSSGEVVRAISSRVLNVVASGQIVVTGAVNLHLVDSATGKVITSVSSLSDELRSDPGLPADIFEFFNTPLGSTTLSAILDAATTVGILLYQEHSEAERQRWIERFVKQMAQSVEQNLLSHSEKAAPAPAHTPPQGD